MFRLRGHAVKLRKLCKVNALIDLISAEPQLIEPVRAERSLRQQAKSKHLGGDTLRLRRYASTLRANGGLVAEIRH